MSRPARTTAVLSHITCLLAAVFGCCDLKFLVAEDRTINQPESKDLTARVTGVVIWSDSSDIRALQLPAMKESVIRELGAVDADIYPNIHAISGPDHLGRIAYIEDHFFGADEKDQKHLLKTIQVDGTHDTVIFSRPGNAMWALAPTGRGEIGRHLALAPRGGSVAFLTGLSPKQMPQALLHEGTIAIWDIDKKLRREREATAKAIDQPMSWFPDGKRLAYTKLVPRDGLPNGALGLAEFGEYAGERWDEVPAIFVLDVQSGKSSFLHVGWTPVVADDGQSVWVGGWDRHSEFSWHCVRNEGRESVPVRWPGGGNDVIAVPVPDCVLFKALPTVGADVARHYAIKVALVGSEKFQTVVPELNRHGRVSFGRVMNRD